MKCFHLPHISGVCSQYIEATCTAEAFPICWPCAWQESALPHTRCWGRIPDPRVNITSLASYFGWVWSNVHHANSWEPLCHKDSQDIAIRRPMNCIDHFVGDIRGRHSPWNKVRQSINCVLIDELMYYFRPISWLN